MLPEIPPKWSKAIIIAVGTAFLSPILLFVVAGQFLPMPPTGRQAEFPQKREQARSGLPTRLKIPKIGVDANLVYVGLTPQGDVGAPEGPSDAAWLDLSKRPGEAGTSIIDGHFGWKDGISAVFNNLSELRVGDKLYVEDENGTTTTFVVRALQTYGEHQNPSNLFASNDGMAHLNLITCEGIWNAAQKSYSERLVVFADKE
ncbi:MAG: class F sortase [Candidatus Pacebacteria bacterium]|nr:class F sortase [Candidatus Paceibacterota bacterium]